MKLLSMLVLVAGLTFGQDAKIMIVEQSDSQKLSKAYKEYKDALKHWDDIKSEVAKTYTTEGNGKDTKTIAGWEKIQFSADFRAIVPDSSQYASHYTCGGWGNISLTNATTTGSPASTLSLAGSGDGLKISGTGNISDGLGNSITFYDTDRDIASGVTVKEK